MQHVLDPRLSLIFALFSSADETRANSKLDTAINARRNLMPLGAFNHGRLDAITEGKNDHDAETAKVAVRNFRILATIAGNCLDQLRANIGAIGDASGVCHKKFRESQ